jgi:pimeloyl-ACP methyl ester carboxylesterase
MPFSSQKVTRSHPNPAMVREPNVKQATVEGVTLTYLEQGQGETVVFIHGAISDHRVWEEQREAVAQSYHYIVPDLRYHGKGAWADTGGKYSIATHASDLATFIQQLGAGPVHVVGWSQGGSIALTLAVQHPELIRSLFVYEPDFDSIVSDPADLEMLGEEGAGLGPTVAASQAGDQSKGVRVFLDWIEAKNGVFQSLPSWRRTLILENSRTLPLYFARPPMAITCEQLGQIEVPVTVAKGQQTRPFFDILADTAHSCIPGSQLVTIPNARHLAPGDNPSAFNEAVMSHLTGN